MKIIILAGGYAKRLWPLTKDKSKALLKINGKCIIDYILEKVMELENPEIIISTNERFADQFREWAKGKNIKIVVEKSQNEEEKLGAIKGIEYVIKQCNINEDCLIIAGDNIFEFSIKDFVSFSNSFCIAVHDIKDYEKAKSFGVVEIDENNKITSFVEKPEKPESTLCATACYYVPKRFLGLFTEYLRKSDKKDSPGFFIEWLSEKEDIYAFKFDSPWFDIGSYESLEKAKNYFESN